MVNEENLKKVKQSMDTYMLPNQTKYCISYILKTGFEKGGVYGRGRIAYVLATELHRVDKTLAVTEKILNKWNCLNSPPLKNSEIRSAIKSAYNTNYTFGCNKEPIIVDTCEKLGGKELCPYYQELTQGITRKSKDRDFYKYKWQKYVTGAEFKSYFGIIELEKISKYKAGSRIYVNHRKFSYVAGVSLQTVGKALTGLQKKGLIKYVPGDPYRWQKKSSEISRIIPIPQRMKNNTAIVKKVEHIIELPNRYEIPGNCGEESENMMEKGYSTAKDI